MLDSSTIKKVVAVCVIAVMAVTVLDGCAPKRRKKKTKSYYIPTTEEINNWIREKRDSNQNMVTVESGRYKLGDNRFKGNPERIVLLEKAFKIDRFEVTNHDWFIFLWATKDSQQYLAAAPIIMGEYDTDKWAKGGKDGKYFQYDHENRAKHPVRSIMYEEAKTFCRFVRKRLPSADEWEMAARGPQGLRYPWGNKYTSADWRTKAQTSFMMSKETTGRPDASSIQRRYDTVAVDSMAEGQSWCGCYHMAGNVSEWTTSQVRTGHGEWKKVPKAERPMAQVVKGGSFFSRQQGSLSAQFFELIPELVSDQFRVGFRCVRD
jgi:formylglycine-generating enzyme required for sulfatase activity